MGCCFSKPLEDRPPSFHQFPSAPSVPSDESFEAFSLTYPEHIPRAIFDPLRIFKDMNRLADRNYEMWTDGTVHEMVRGSPLVTDPELIAFERARAAEAEAQDAAGEGSAEARVSCALRVDFLVALTFELNLWHWSTREVVAYLVKPSTEFEGRCRFARHPIAMAYSGQADVMMSHYWDGSWGTLIACAAQGSSMGDTSGFALSPTGNGRGTRPTLTSRAW